MQQQAPFNFHAAAAISQSKPDMMQPTCPSLSFGTTNAPSLSRSATPGISFGFSQLQMGQLSAQPSLPALTSLAHPPSTSSSTFNFTQLSSTPQFQFGQANTGPPTTNSSLFQFGDSSNMSIITGDSTPSVIPQATPTPQLGMSSLSGPVGNAAIPALFSSGTGIGGRPIKKAVRRRR